MVIIHAMIIYILKEKDLYHQIIMCGGEWKTKNYMNMREADTPGADKYFHALANCQSAQQGHPINAKILSAGREVVDTLIKYPLKGVPMDVSVPDAIDDWKVDMYGLNQGLQYPNNDCRVLINKYRPDGLNSKY